MKKRTLDDLPMAPDGQGCMSVPCCAVSVQVTPCLVSAWHFGASTTREKRYTYDVLRCICN